jgi:very-short-patch-repair endonuclease
MSVAAREAFDLRSPFRLEDALAVGLSSRALRTKRFQRVFKGVYVAAAVPLDVATRAKAALLLHPLDAHASHTTAAHLLGIPVPDESFVHVTVRTPEDRNYRPGLKPHVREGGSDVVLVNGIRVTSPQQLFVELAATLPLVDAVVAVDAMLRLKLVTLAHLWVHCDRIQGQRHSRSARRVLKFARENVDSPMETRLRMLLVLAGLPEPKVAFNLVDDDGVVLRRLDLSYPDVRLIVEYDGRHHIERVQQWASDLDRREEFDRGNWRIVVVTSAGIYKEPARTIRRVREALRSRGVPIRGESDAWRPHFPTR